MKKKKKYSIRRVLTLVVFLLLFSMFSALTVYFVIRETSTIQDNVSQTVELKVQQISGYLDDEVTQLTTVALNISYSNLVKERFTVYATENTADTPSEKYQFVENTKVLTDMLTAIIGPMQPASQIYLYSLSGQRFGVGKSTATSMVELADMPWYNALLVEGKYNYIYSAPDETLDTFFTIQKDLPFLSFCALYYNNYNQVQGVIEVKSPMTNLQSKIDMLGTPYNETVYLFDSAGQPVRLPGNEAAIEDSTGYFTAMLQAAGTNTPYGSGVAEIEGTQRETLFYAVSDSTGFTTVVVVSNDQMMAPIYSYLQGNLLILAFIALAAFLLSFLAARFITNPITKIYSEVQRIPDTLQSTGKVASLPPISTKLVEMDALYNALVEMQQRVRQSMEKEAILHQQETQARMLALQSQMNPHFLHNSLTTLVSMADEGMNEEIQDMCRTISSILRYISSDKELLVPLEADLDHTADYLHCMKMRHAGDLEYNIAVPEEMLGIRVPKLCLQPIVENAIKFTTQAITPPWQIDITGSVSETEWHISITDSGSGFSQETLQSLEAQIEAINQTGLLPSLELNGMGILNIYIRLKLLYEDKQIFKIGNAPQGGARVIIGGRLNGR